MLAVALHRQLLEVGREALQVLVVRQHRDRLRAEEIVVPDASAGPSAPAGSARTARCGSARPSRGSRRASRGSSPGRSRSSSTGRSPSPSSSGRRPSPRSRTCWRCRCRTSTTSSALVETATKCLATAVSSPQRRQQPGARRVRVGHRLQRGERLRRDDEQRLGRIEVARRLGEVGAVDVRDEAERQVALRCSAAAPRRPSPGPRSEPPMPMLTTLRMRLPVWPFHAPLRTRSAKSRHPVEHRVDLRHDVLAVDHDRRRSRGARRATCSTARFSVMLIFSPRNIASMRSAQAALARPAATSSRSVSSVMRFFE